MFSRPHLLLFVFTAGPEPICPKRMNMTTVERRDLVPNLELSILAGNIRLPKTTL